MSGRWTHRPDGSNWGDFGADDQLGRLNLLTPEKVRQGAAEVREGLSFCLSLPLDYPGGNALNPSRFPPELGPTFHDGNPRINFPLSIIDAANTDVVSDDRVSITLQYSTQWDSLAHVGSHFDADGDGVAEKVYYNGYRAGEAVIGPKDYDDPSSTGERAHVGAVDLGIENMAEKAIQGRGVLVDLSRSYGRGRTLVGYDELMRCMEETGAEVESGDMLVLRTGFAEVVMEMQRRPDPDTLHDSCAVLNGRDDRLLQWITDSGIAAICADNYAVEAYPAPPKDGPRPALPIHEHCLFKLGLPLAELWYLKDLGEWLAANDRTRFMLTAPPLRLPGAVGSPVTPVATV